MIIHKKNSIQIYYRTLDMYDVSQFEDSEIAKNDHTYRAKLWRSLDEWTRLVSTWENTVFNNIDVKNISQVSETY